MVPFPRFVLRGGFDFSRLHPRTSNDRLPGDPEVLLPGYYYEITEHTTIDTNLGPGLFPLEDPSDPYKSLFSAYPLGQATNFGEEIPVFMPPGQMVAFVIFLLYHHCHGHLVLLPGFLDFVLAAEILQGFGPTTTVNFTVIFVFQGRRLARIRVIRTTRIDATIFWMNMGPRY
ncbi:hypothetical protein SISSUDRAFT_1121008 [Sistotremastrum suecicum HHB10207 ss-3]|uniref:Uncharacterized protein n=1 Tax=Sistotremastrum suecicum HHB10207 ss-3 TaxID=1314776 RepID=A0A166BFX2_9AGAM|nr:hypothetical protein SISSUDRAFT_1121008 [Sistotremastrum suecicum HHB10207 ss-3]